MKIVARCAAVSMTALLLVSASAAWAKPRLELKVTQFREVTEKKPDGSAGVKLVPASDVKPGDVVQYVLEYANRGDEVAKDAVIADPIPKGTTYLADTAAGQGAELAFSIDGGKTYAPADRLTHDVKAPSGAVEKKPATPGEYTHIRWTVKTVEAGAGGSVSFKVRIN